MCRSFLLSVTTFKAGFTLRTMFPDTLTVVLIENLHQFVLLELPDCVIIVPLM